MNNEQLVAILTSIVDILTVMNTAYADDHGQTDAIIKVRALIVTASTVKHVQFGGSGSVSV